jgi:formate dehydrogenase subunit gamma
MSEQYFSGAADFRAANWDEEAARAVVARWSGRDGPLMPVLHEIQAQFGYIAEPAIAVVAEGLNLSRAEVLGVVSFYHDFRTAPPARRVVRLCRAEACQAAGCEEVVAELARRHGVAVDAPGEALAVESVYCLGNCALGPSAMVGEELVGRVDVERLAELCGLVP